MFQCLTGEWIYIYICIYPHLYIYIYTYIYIYMREESIGAGEMKVYFALHSSTHVVVAEACFKKQTERQESYSHPANKKIQQLKNVATMGFFFA